ncbi:MAG: agmatine deiminase family protein, partial [Rhodanobacteraceae bacterium]
MIQSPLRLPAEWEPQAAVLLAWPHVGTDWAARLDAVEDSYAALVAAITRFEQAIICVPDGEIGAHAAALLRDSGADLGQVRFVEIPYDDTWVRDSGPITLQGANGAFVLLDFRFTGWGGKFEASQDDALVAGLIERGVFRSDAQHQRVDWALEGGAIESDGRGTILTTWRCLQARHPDESRDRIELTLRSALSASRVLWLEHGYLQGDDTDAHIDTLARLAPDEAIV